VGNRGQRANSPRSEDREPEPRQRLLSRERRRVFGLLVIAFIILAIAFLRFGKTIPWGAR
jgi:hypothetical protein